MFKDNSLNGTKAYFAEKLQTLYKSSEIDIFFEMICQSLFDLTKTSILLNEYKLTESELIKVKKIADQLIQHKPIQQILGIVNFYGYSFKVNEHVLIPRAETEELVELILKNDTTGSLLDIGTGTGVIPIILKLKNHFYNITAIDISDTALEIARSNAIWHQVDIDFKKKDILKEELNDTYDIIVSNPPYVLESDKKTMSPNVLNYEPHLALFVPDEDPLKFYKAILLKAKQALNKGGSIYFEIHENMGRDMQVLLAEEGYQNVQLIKDMQGKDRMIYAKKSLT